MTARPLRPWAQASRSLLRDTVLRATDELLAERVWSEITMGQVARAAGVSRQTVYNEFGNRRDLALSYASWAGDQLLDEVERCVAQHRDDPLDALVAAFAVFLDLGAGHPLVRSLGDSSGADELASALTSTTRQSPIVTGASRRLADIIATTWPELPADAVAVASEVLVRLAVSHLLQPTAEPEDAARQVAVVLAPFLAHVRAMTSP
jgi:AcrR family transcriptional regulator